MDNSNMPLVSIIFTSYNHQEYLKQALDSLLAQSYANIEVVIIDDCSTDGSQEILKQYGSHPKVNLKLQEKNSGSYVKASNLGASYAKGEYLLFAQCDDFAEPTQLEKLLRTFEGNPSIGVAFCKSLLIDEQGKSLGDDFQIREASFRKFCESNVVIPKRRMREFLSKSCVIPNLSAAMIKREIFLKSGGLSTDYLVAADWAFWLTLTELCDFYYVAEKLNNFRQHQTTIRSTIKIKKQILEIYQIFYTHISKYKITGEDKYQFRVGAGAIFISYLSLGFKSWLLSFPSLIKITYQYEKLNVWFIIMGLFYKIKESFLRKVSI
jgi:glycosyltransferase involved in cell wall biosynthesis